MVKQLITWLRTLWCHSKPVDAQLLRQHEAEDKSIEEAHKRVDSLMRATEQRDPRTHH